ncbi:MAG: hypothetical protein IT172_06800 [Acidobacteria bacterium]|nr:hypothetical protein [Acidobacteriota bacterium]
MYKQRNHQRVSSLLVIFSLGFLAIFANSLFGQEIGKPCTGEKFIMPTSLSVNYDVLEQYVKIARTSFDDRKVAFANQTSEQKAHFIKLNLALQLVRRPNLNDEQRAFVLKLLSEASPAVYDQSRSAKVTGEMAEIINRAFGLFSRAEIGDFIEPLNTEKSAEIALVGNYRQLLKSGMHERIAKLKQMPLGERVNIWKTQLAYHLASANLSDVQRAFIVDMMTSLNEQTFSVATTKEEGGCVDGEDFRQFYEIRRLCDLYGGWNSNTCQRCACRSS